MSDISLLKVNGTTYDIKDSTARTKLEDKLENINIDGTAQAINNKTINLKTITSAEVIALFE